MTEAVKIQLILSGTSIVIALMTTYFAYRAKVTSEKTEQNTNHMKDELVQSVKEAAYEAGLEHEKGNPS